MPKKKQKNHNFFSVEMKVENIFCITTFMFGLQYPLKFPVNLIDFCLQYYRTQRRQCRKTITSGQVKIQRVFLYISAVHALSIILCCIRSAFAKQHTAFQFSHDNSIRLTRLSGVTWDPIVLFKKFHRYSQRGQVKNTWSTDSSYFDMFYTSRQRRVHTCRGVPYNTRGPLRAVKDTHLRGRISFQSILLYLVLICKSTFPLWRKSTHASTYSQLLQTIRTQNIILIMIINICEQKC